MYIDATGIILADDKRVQLVNFPTQGLWQLFLQKIE